MKKTFSILSIIGAVAVLFLFYQEPWLKMNSLTEDAVSKSNSKKNIKIDRELENINDDYYAVSTSHPEATKIGVQVLESGGNAVDAAIAISYALGVVEPYASGIGGGGGMLIYDPESGYHGVNYRDRGTFSHTNFDSSIAIPGFVLGMEAAAEKFGNLSIEDLIDPSIKLADKGIEIDSVTESYFKTYNSLLEENTDYLDKHGNVVKRGSVMKPKKLLNTMKLIQKDGSEAFYKGAISKAIVDETWLTNEDLAQMTVDFPEPVVSNYRGNEIASLGSPFSGVTLIQMLKLAEIYDLPNPSENTNEYINNYIELHTHSYNDRLKNSGDPEFYSIENQYLVSDDYVFQLSNNNYLLEEDTDEESVLTTHFVVMDQNGMMVSVTNTLGTFFGSQVEVEGIYLNAAMNSFSRSGVGINRFEPGKQPRNFTAPTIIRNGEGIVGIGSPGGRMIPEFIFQVVEEHYHHGSAFEEVVEKNRFTLEKPDRLLVEDNPRREDLLIKENLPNLNVEYLLSDSFYGAVNVIEKKEDGSINGVADSRRNGSVIINKMVNK